MSNIKGLIVKDFLQLKDFKIPLLFWTSVFIVLSLALHFTNLIAIITSFGFGMMVVFAFTFDEMSNEERHIASMPFKRNEIVLSKYILSVITTVMGAVIGDIINILIQIISIGRVEHLVRTLSVGLIGMFVMAVFNSIQIPCVLKNGAEKSRMLVFTVGGIITLVCVAIYKLGKLLNVVLPLDILEKIYNQYWFFLYVISIVVLYFISYKISCKIYDKKDI